MCFKLFIVCTVSHFQNQYHYYSRIAFESITSDKKKRNLLSSFYDVWCRYYFLLSLSCNKLLPIHNLGVTVEFNLPSLENCILLQNCILNSLHNQSCSIIFSIIFSVIFSIVSFLLFFLYIIL